MAVSAGLGVACLNESALVPDRTFACAWFARALPLCGIRLLPARNGESVEFIGL